VQLATAGLIASFTPCVLASSGLIALVPAFSIAASSMQPA
jgi:hypothetical protein